MSDKRKLELTSNDKIKRKFALSLNVDHIDNPNYIEGSYGWRVGTCEKYKKYLESKFDNLEVSLFHSTVGVTRYLIEVTEYSLIYDTDEESYIDDSDIEQASYEFFSALI